MPFLLKPPTLKQPHCYWSGLTGAATGLAIAETARQHQGPIVVIASSARQQQLLEMEIRFFLNGMEEDIPVAFFPTWECLPYDRITPHPDIISQRLALLATLPEIKQGIIIVGVDNLIQRLPDTAYVAANRFALKTGARINIDKLRQQLARGHYASVDTVISAGEYAVRGGLIDIYPMGTASPFRIDLFDDEIETIRTFDPETQRSGDTIDTIDILPAREFPTDEAAIKRFRGQFRDSFSGDPLKHSVYTAVSEGHIPAGAEFFFPLFMDSTSTFFDYLPSNSALIFSNDIDETATTLYAEITDRYMHANTDISFRVLPPERLYLDPEALKQALDAWPCVELTYDEHNHKNNNDHWHTTIDSPKNFPVNPKQDQPYQLLIEHLIDNPKDILITAETIGRLTTLKDTLSSVNINVQQCDHFFDFLARRQQEAGPWLCIAPLERGLTLAHESIEIIGELQLYGERAYQGRRPRNKARDPETIIRSLAELSIGDPVVHIDHGVGRYQGLHHLDIDGDDTEYMIITYQDNDKLYVPILALDQISRFIGASPENAPLHKLGGTAWEKAKKKAKEKAYDIAAELLEIAALRAARKGIAYEKKTRDYDRFKSHFPYDMTPDQEQVMEEIETDLANATPMDRLVCGDVGFGKTEIALRTAFLVSDNQRQVAILAPTTLLAEQHFSNFSDRFAQTNIRIGILSRMQSNKQIATTLEKLKAGEIDIIIGTHRLLQQDIQFCDLGLLVIDEEHRFGVRQKERIKQLRSEIDILTLTATPIPRTLNVTMAGLRDISIIASPPKNRLAVKTFVRNTQTTLIREACLREIRRGGQVYYLHNNVKTIERVAEDLQTLIPESRVRFGHGQLSEAALERVMQDFYHQRFNIFVCTTIIESGIDIPLANTIIIDRADRFGLAQLHQLRGRVGRSHHQAYAYLLVNDIASVSKDAKKRLEAIESLAELGAGFSLATHDLEIRGAGELLGESQSGSVDDIGFSLYNEYLSMAVKSLKQDKARPTQQDPIHSQLELHIPALFPDDYLGNTHTRLVLYKRIASAVDDEALNELQIEVIDRFGLMPDAAKNLFLLTSLRRQAETLGIHKVDIDTHGGTIDFDINANIDPEKLFALIQSNTTMYQFLPPQRLKIKASGLEPAERLSLFQEIIMHLSD